MALKFARNKIVALLLGPSGIGLLGLYQSIADLTRAAVGLGVNSSGVRQIAEAAGTKDSSRVSMAVIALRRVSFALGAVGALLLIIFSGPLSRYTFGEGQHGTAVIMLSAYVFLTCVSDSQMAVLQGLRRIRQLATVNILGAAAGTAACIPLLYYFRHRGVVMSIVAGAACSICFSWWMVRKIKIQTVALPKDLLWKEVRALANLGIVMLSATLMATGAAYLIRSFISRNLGVNAAGQYQAAWTVAGQYVNFILQAMAVDFYPRLTAVEKDRATCNRLINEQAEVGILMAGPGILATLTFAPLVIQLFYSARFGPAVDLLRWNCLGMLFRVAAWPMGYLMLARNARRLYFITGLLVHTSNVALVLLLTPKYGLTASGAAVFVSCVFDFVLMNVVATRLNGFRWSKMNVQWGALLAPVTAALFIGGYFLPRPWVLAFGTAATLVSGVISARMLCSFVPLHRFPGPLRKLVVRLGWLAESG